MERFYLETKVQAGDAGAISGLAWKFGVPDRSGDEILPGAFKGAKPPLPLLFGHDMSDPVGALHDIKESAAGFEVAGKLLIEDLERAREVRALVTAGAVRGMSIGFLTKAAKAKPGGGRIISALDLYEVSLVTVPMHPGARVTSAKSAIEALSIAAAIQRANFNFQTRTR